MIGIPAATSSDVIHLTPQELAERLRMSVGALANWRVSGKGPKFLKLGRKVLYPMTEIEAWEKNHTMTNTLC